MEYFIGVVAMVSLVLNYLIFKRITATYTIGTVEEFELATSHFCRCEAVEPSGPVQLEVHDPVSEQVIDRVYSAWTNQKDIPWSPPIKKPEPIVKPPNRGPLERPDGFV